MDNATDFLLSAEEEREIVEAIQHAEKETSGEIRVHIEKTTNGDAVARATEVFQQLGMHATALKNGVLIYLAYESRKFAICGDKGIDEAVPENFWDSTKELMQEHFREGKFKLGLLTGITLAGEKLRTYFPCDDDDVDELSNEISRG